METSEKKHILFVDDEPHVLSGMKRALFLMSDEWEMFFVTSGAEALEILSNQAIDVIVSDMKMPEMDGADLLMKVKDLYPQVIRIVLSGFSDLEMIIKTLKTTDQFLSKPCDPDTLKMVIDKALHSQKIIGMHDLRALISGIDSLPTVPDTYVQLREVLENPKSTIQDIVAVISKDVTVTAKILQLVNSAFFGVKHHIDNITHAVAYLGVDTLKAVLLTDRVFCMFSKEEMQKFDIPFVFKHSFHVGALARKVAAAMTTDRRLLEHAGIAGMLHDVGKIVLMRVNPKKYELLLIEKNADHTPTHILERDILGVSHCDVGAYLMSVWGLPQHVVDAILYHHNPFSLTGDDAIVPAAVYIANGLAQEVKEGRILEDDISLDVEYLKRLNLDQQLEQLRTAFAEIQKDSEAIGNMLAG